MNAAACLFDVLAERHAADVVLIGDEENWRAGDLLATVEELADRLSASCILAVLADNSPQWVLADLAALRAGVVHLPLPAFFSSSQLVHALTQTATDTVLTDQPERIVELALGFAVAERWQGLTWLQRTTQPAPLPAGTAKVSFTSGSTGTPRGVCLSRAGLLETARAVNDRLADLPIVRHLAVLPLAMLLENCAGIHASLLRGTQVILPGLARLGWRGSAAFDAAAFAHLLDGERPDSLILVPEVLKSWISRRTTGASARSHAPAFVAVGGARVAPQLLSRARSCGIPAYQGYGLTECGSVVSVNRPGDDGDGVGRPLAHVTARIVKEEVWISTPAFLGYLGEGIEAATTEPERCQEFATGDLGHFDAAGHLHLAGRRKHLLITSFGRNVAPEWIESVLLAQPAVAQAAVFGDGQPWLCAVLVPAADIGPPALAQAVATANAQLPDYARVARWLLSAGFTVANGLATGNGRPIRSAVHRHFAAELAALYRHEETIETVL